MLYNNLVLQKNTIKNNSIKKKINDYNEYIKSDSYKYEQYKKMLNFLNCINLKELEKTFFKMYFLWWNYGKKLTYCIKQSFTNNNLTKKNPYYTTDELIN